MCDVAGTERIAEDHTCLHCGYNLRGLTTDGKCPECFTPVWQSLRGDLLRHADPGWLDKLRFGSVLKLWNMVLGIIVGGAAGILVAVGLPPVLLTILAIVGGSFGLWASFVITTQEPRISLQEDPITLRKVIRICATVGFVGNVIQQFNMGSAVSTSVLILGSALGLAGVVALFGELLYFSRFALRKPDTKLARSTRIVMWGLAITVGCIFALGILSTLVGVAPPGAGVGAPAPAPTGIGLLIVGSMCVVLVPTLVFSIWYVVLLFRYKRVFTEATAQSRSLTQQSADTPPKTDDDTP